MYSVLYRNYMAMTSNTYRQILLGSELLARTSKNIAKGYVTLHAIAMQPAVQHQGKTVMDLKHLTTRRMFVSKLVLGVK